MTLEKTGDVPGKELSLQSTRRYWRHSGAGIDDRWLVSHQWAATKQQTTDTLDTDEGGWKLERITVNGN